MDYYLGSGSKKRRLTDTEDAHEEQGTKQEDKARSMRTALAQKDWFLRYPAPQKAITTQISTGNNACESPTPPITPQKASKLVVKRTGDYAVELGLFNNMPDEIAVLVLAQLPELKYFSALHSVCKRFAELTDDKLLWKIRYFDRWNLGCLFDPADFENKHAGNPPSPAAAMNSHLLDIDWKKLYLSCHISFTGALSWTSTRTDKQLPALDHSTTLFQPQSPNVAIISGKYVFETRVSGLVQIGFLLPEYFCAILRYIGVGDEEFSWSWDGSRCRAFHNGWTSYGARWRPDDIVGTAISVSDQQVTIEYFLNGNSMGIAHQLSKENLYKMRWQYWETAGYNLNNKLKDIYPLLFPGISIWENPGCYAYVNFGPQLNFKYPGYEPVVCDQLKAFWDMGNKALGAKDELYMAIIAQKIPYNEIRDGDRDSARLRIMRAEYGAASDEIGDLDVELNILQALNPGLHDLYGGAMDDEDEDDDFVANDGEDDSDDVESDEDDDDGGGVWDGGVNDFEYQPEFEVDDPDEE